jgi:hypothetical protein
VKDKDEGGRMKDEAREREKIEMDDKGSIRKRAVLDWTFVKDIT